jgi:PAS domain S-box-containing protein
MGQFNRKLSTEVIDKITGYENPFWDIPGLILIIKQNNLRILQWNEGIDKLLSLSKKNTKLSLYTYIDSSRRNIVESELNNSNVIKLWLQTNFGIKEIVFKIRSIGTEQETFILTSNNVIDNTNESKKYSLEHIFNIFEGLDYHLIAIDQLTHRIIKCNENAEQQFQIISGVHYCHEKLWGKESEQCKLCLRNNLIDECLGRNNTVHYHKNLKKWFQVKRKNYTITSNKKILLIIASDITNEKALEEELIKSKNKNEIQANELSKQLHLEKEYLSQLNELQRLAKMGNYITNLKENYWTASDNFYKLFGLERKERYTMEEFQNLVHPDDIQDVMEVFNDCLKTGKPFDYKYRCIRADDQRVIHIKSNSTVITDEQGNPAKIIGIKQDITKQVLYEQELKQVSEKSKESEKLKTAFLANVSHEIRTPLNGILGFSSLLTRKSNSKEKIEYYHSLITENSNQLLKIIDDVLQVSKLNSNQLEINMHQYDLNATLYEEATNFKISNTNELIEIEININQTPNIVFSDEKLLKIALNRIFENAIKFTTEGKITITLTQNKNNNIISVTDTGIGIPISLHEKIFEPFRQQELEANRMYGGTGLGLTIARGVIEKLFGHVWVDSTQNTTTFNISIPTQKFQKNNNSKTELHPETCLKNKNILIVEDNEDISFYISELLKSKDCNVMIAENGINALKQYYLNGKIDLVLMDIRMPYMDGFETAERLKKYDNEIIIIAQSAFYDKNEEAQKVFMGPFNDYIKKPIDSKFLIDRIINHLCLKNK